MTLKTSRYFGKFKGKVVLITGASSGIGEFLSRELAAAGASVALAARRTDRLQRICDEITASGGSAIALSCDVTRDGELEKAVGQILARFGRLDVAVANAGFGVVGKVENLSLDDYRRQFETNVFGVLRTIYATLPELKKTKGQLVLLGSVASYVCLPSSTPYAMSKFSIRALAEALTDELRPEGVAVTLLSPGFVDSDIRRVDNKGQHRPDVKDPLPAWIPMPTDRAVVKMAKAIATRRREEIITHHGKVIVFIQRHFPWIIHGVTRVGLAGRPEPKI